MLSNTTLEGAEKGGALFPVCNQYQCYTSLPSVSHFVNAIESQPFTIPMLTNIKLAIISSYSETCIN